MRGFASCTVVILFLSSSSTPLAVQMVFRRIGDVCTQNCAVDGNNMTLEVLLSCMHQTDISLVEKSEIRGDVLLINQTDREERLQMETGEGRICMISTRQRGLSRSRNMALQESGADICLLADDDEVFHPEYRERILRAFTDLADADVIAFDLENKRTSIGPKVTRIGRLNSLKLCSCQLAMRRERILEKKLAFDPDMGSGSGNGCGEENKFLLDCLRAGLRIYYVPVVIARLETSHSEWFDGFDSKFFYQRGAATRYMLGLLPAVAYGVYYLLAKRSLYGRTISTKDAALAMVKGMRDNTIYECKKKHG